MLLPAKAKLSVISVISLGLKNINPITPITPPPPLNPPDICSFPSFFVPLPRKIERK